MKQLWALQDISENPLWKKQIQSRLALKEINQKVWSETNLFSPIWWLMVVVFIVMWGLWWKLVDKARLLEIMTYGLMVAIFMMFIDSIATQSLIWGFPNRLTPFSPPLIFLDLCVLPVTYMLVYQYCNNWRSFTVAMIITAAILSFVVEPLAIRLDIFEMYHWSVWLSFPLYLVIGFTFRGIVNGVKAIQVRARRGQ
ncbi:MAG TPA: CBO0543 family protein [Bacillota bacterium]|nr:CBO0543 family protein [Bacillota bacterium]